MKSEFVKEKDLVRAFISHIENNQYDMELVTWSCEFNFAGGRTDIIAENPDKKVYAFEAKLHNLGKVINQAYRNTSFADYSFVVLPESRKLAANKWALEFKRRKIGLVIVNAEKAWTEIDACHHSPLLPWLKDKADKTLAGKRRYVKNGRKQVP